MDDKRRVSSYEVQAPRPQASRTQGGHLSQLTAAFRPINRRQDTLLEYSANQQDAPRQILCRNLGYTTGHYLIWGSSGGSTGRVPPFYFNIQGVGGETLIRPRVTMGG